MKLGKLLTVTALATGITLGAFVDSAEAQIIEREGDGYSERGGNQEDVFNTFILYDQQPDGQPIIDDDRDLNNNRGLFIGAVEDFKTYSNFSLFNPSDEVDFNNLPKPDAMAAIANLEVRWFRNDEINKELELEATYNGNIIEYTISGQGNSPNKPSDLIVYLLDTKETESAAPPLPIDFTPQKATNDLSYIFDNILLDKAIPFLPRGFGGLKEIDDKLASDPPMDLVEDDFFGGTSFEQKIKSTSVPESDSITSLLVLGAVGVSFGLKQKMK